MTMPTPAWLHVNGVSIQTENSFNGQSSEQRFDDIVYSPLTGSISNVDGQVQSRQMQRFESSDLPKKIFLERQIKKAKASPGLIKGTALSRQTSLNSASSGKINISTSIENLTHDDSKTGSADDLHSEHLSASTQNIERTNETRRPRVYFADVNRVQFFENNRTDEDLEREMFTSKLRRSRTRVNKKTTALIANESLAAPTSIQQSQSLYTPYSTLSRQDLSSRKTIFNVSPRIQSSRVTHLPDIINQSTSNETPIKERYVLQREKPILRLPEANGDSSGEVSRESTRTTVQRTSNSVDSSTRFDLDESTSLNTLTNNSYLNSSSTSRQRVPLSTISLRHHFFLSPKPKSVNIRRSVSLKPAANRLNSAEDESSPIPNQHEPVILSEIRPMTGTINSKKPNRNYMVHFNGRPNYGVNNSNEIHTNSYKPMINPIESSQDRFLRSSYMSSLNNLPIGEPTRKTQEGSLKSARTSSTRRSNEFQLTSNTIIV